MGVGAGAGARAGAEAATAAVEGAWEGVWEWAWACEGAGGDWRTGALAGGPVPSCGSLVWAWGGCAGCAGCKGGEIGGWVDCDCDCAVSAGVGCWEVSGRLGPDVDLSGWRWEEAKVDGVALSVAVAVTLAEVVTAEGGRWCAREPSSSLCPASARGAEGDR